MAFKHRVSAKPAAKASVAPAAAKPSLSLKARPFAPRHDDGHDTEKSNATSIGKAIQARLMDMPVYSSESGASLRRSPATPEEEKEDLTIQPKLTIGQPGDKYEQEADQMAAQVMRMPDSALTEETEDKEEGLQRQAMPEQEEEDLAQAKFQISRQPMEEEKEDIKMKPSVHRQAMSEEEEETLQAKAKPQIQEKGTASQVPDNFAGQLAQQKGSGQPLSDETRAFMEPRFGSDFSNVRVHETPDLANSIQAQAFTDGSDIYFNSEKYTPGSSGGKELLAHELTHVVQQVGSIQKQGEVTKNTSFEINHQINYISQHTETSCWSAALGMLLGVQISVGPGNAPLNSDGTLPEMSVSMIANMYGLQLYGPRSWPVFEFAKLLENGPLMVGGRTGATNRDGNLQKHFLIIGGVRGDGTPENTKLTIYDPADPESAGYYEKYSDWLRMTPQATEYILHQ